MLSRLAAYLKALILMPMIVHRTEQNVATAAEQIQELSARVDDLIADVRAALNTLTTERENLTPTGQAALDELSAKLAAFDTEVGDADGSDSNALN